MGYLVIAAFVGLVLLGLAQWGHIARGRRSDDGGGSWGQPLVARAGRPDAAAGERDLPDAPRPFGRRMAWFAVRADDAARVAKVLGLRTVQPTNWEHGLAAAAEGGLFVTPSIDGVVFAAGRDAFPCPGDERRRIGETLLALAGAFGDSLWFATHDGVDYHGWAAARGPRLVRGYAYDGDNSAVVWEEGPVTSAEAELGFFAEDPRDTSGDALQWWPQSRDVLRLAGSLGADPTQIPCAGAPCRGLLGRL